MRYYVITAIIALAAAKAQAKSGTSMNIGSSKKKKSRIKTERAISKSAAGFFPGRIYSGINRLNHQEDCPWGRNPL